MRMVLGTTLTLALIAGAGADEKKDVKIDARLLVGKWKQVEPDKGPQLTVEYTADGRMSGTADLGDGTILSFAGTYKVDGNTITQTFVFGGTKTEKKTVGTITKLTDEVLESTSEKGLKARSKRVPKK
jgi:uncharacterized protein (TIGR03066 family)